MHLPETQQTVRSHATTLTRDHHAPSGIRLWSRQLRIHQWLKNLLVFVPLLTAFVVTAAPSALRAAAAFMAFCLAASATYVFNDLRDLANDRVHPRKRERPLASGAIQPKVAIAVAIALLAAAVIVGAGIGLPFLIALITYVVATIAYSWRVKQFVLLDVMLLSALYTIRIVGGAAAIDVQLSVWLLTFSVFFFLSLALTKRCTELITIRQRTLASHGRDYRAEDLSVVFPMAVAAGFCSVVVFIQFVSSPETASKYASPEMLWVVGFALIAWLGRLWINTARNQMHDDPLVYALRDTGSLVLIGVMIFFTLLARVLSVQPP